MDTLNIFLLWEEFQWYWKKLRQFDVEEDKVTADTDLQEDLGADSLDVVDLLMSIEDEFGVEVPDDEIENIKTVGSLVSYIEANA
mgnify:CR=1 FL=1